MTQPQFESCQMYIFKIYSSSTIHQTTTFNLKCIFVHSHAHPLSKKVSILQIIPQFESCQMYIFKIYSSSTIHQTTTFNLKCIFVHSHAHPLSKNWLSQHIFKKQIPNWRKWPQFESCQMYIFKIYSSSTIHQTTTFNLKCIFVHSHAHPLSKNWLSQHIFKKQIPNWRKWPQFESCQMYIFKIYSSSTIHQTTTFNLKCIFVHSHAHPLSKNWLSQHIFKKQIPNWRKLPQFESCQMYIFKIYSSSTIHQTTTFNLKCIFVHSHAHPLSKNWLSQHIFKKQIPNWRKLPQFESCQMYIFKIYSSSTIHQTTTFNLKCIFVHSHAHPLSKNWLSQHIFKKQIPNWRKWPQFESCQMYIFKIYSSSTIHQTTTFNLKCIFVHSHAHPLSKNWLSQHIFKKQIPNWRKLPQFESCQMYIFKIYSSSTIHQTTTFNLKCIFVHSHAHPLSKNWLSQHIFKKQIPNWRKWPQFESCQMYIFKIYSSSTIHQTTTFNLKCIFVHSHAHPLSKNWLSQHIFKKQIPNWRKWPQFESCQMYIFKIYSSSTIHQTTTFNLKCIFVHSHAHPLSKNWLSQHIFKKQIPNWRKWPQFESCQMYIFKIYSSSTIHQTTTFNLKCIFVHSHAHPLSKNWLSQHIFKKQIPNWRKLPQFESCQMYIFKIYSSSTIHQTTTFNLKCIFVHSHAHPLSKNWLSQHIFKKQIPNWRKLPQFESCQMYIFKIYSSSTIHQTTTFNLKCIFVHSHAHPLSKNWLSQHIFKKQIPNWRKWPQFESCQMYIFKIYSSSTIHQTTTFNLKCIFVHSHAHPLSKNWLSQHIFKKQIPNWRKWPQFESCQMYIFKIYSSSTIHQTTTFNLKCIFVHSHAHPLSKNWLSQHIFKKQIPNWRKLPQFESSTQMYIFKIYSSSTNVYKIYSSTIHQQPSTSNAYLSTPMHTLWAKIGWVSIFLKNRFQIDANDLNLRVAKCIFSKSTPHQQYTRQQPSTSNAYLSTPMHTLWAKIGWVSIFLKNRFQIDANDLNLRVAKCIFSKSTPHQQYTRQQPSTSNAYLSTPMHTLWAKIGWVSIFLKNRFQIDANDLNLRVAKCIFSKSTPHQQYTRQQPSTSNAYLSTPMHTLWAKIGWVSIFLKNRFQIDANDLNLRVAKCIFSKSTPHQQYTRQQPSTSNAYLSTPMHTLWAKIGWVSIFLKNRFQIDANDLNLRVAKCIFSKSTPHQQYTRQQPSTSNAYLSTPMHTLWAKIGWVSIFLKNRFQIDANDLNLRVAKCIFSKSTPHQQYTRQQPSTSNAYLSTPMHTLWAKIGWVSIFLKNRFQIDANDLNLRVAKCIFSKSTPHQQYTRQQPSTSNAYLSTPMHTLWAKIGWVSIFLKNRFQIDANHHNLRVPNVYAKSTSIWELPNVYFQNLLLINNTPDNNLQPQMHICPLPCTPFEQKLAESAYF